MTPAHETAPARGAWPRTEHVGSLLRPQRLLEARRRWAAGQLTRNELVEVEDAAILTALQRQRSEGIDVVGDGEFRRTDFRAGFAAAVSGLREEVRDTAWHSGRVVVATRRWHVDGAVRRVSPIAIGEADFLAQHARTPFKITLPAPGYAAERFFDPSAAGSPYASVRELGDAFVDILRQEVTDLIATGTQYVQFDNPGYATFLDQTARDRLAAAGRDPDQAFQDMLDADVTLLDSIPRPDGMVVGLHVCRGNNAGQWLHQGGYEPIAERLFAALPVDRLLLEFDDERSGSLSVLRDVPAGKTAVVGLISTKSAEIEDSETLLRRLDEAARYIDPGRLAISPQCGFATHAEGGNPLTEDEQYRKLELCVEVADRYFG